MEQKSKISIKVVSYNIRIGFGGDEKIEWQKRVAQLEPIVSVLEPLNADIIFLQEVDRHRQRSQFIDEAQYLANRLGMSFVFGRAYSENSGEYGNAILSKYLILESRTYLLYKPDYSVTHPEYPAWYSEQRNLLYAKIAIDTEHIVHCFNTHLGVTEDQREKQIDELLQHANSIEGLKIIGGDLNAPLGSKEIKKIKSFYKDVFPSRLKNSARATYPAGTNAKECLDYLFVSKQFKVKEAQVIMDTTLASDHNPIITVLEI